MSTFSLGSSDWAYLNLEIISNVSIDIDIISWKLIISKALAKFSGIHGLAVQVDIMHINTTSDDKQQSWIRVPESSLSQTWAALSGAEALVFDKHGKEVVAQIRVLRASRYLVGITSTPEK